MKENETVMGGMGLVDSAGSNGKDGEKGLLMMIRVYGLQSPCYGGELIIPGWHKLNAKIIPPRGI